MVTVSNVLIDSKSTVSHSSITYNSFILCPPQNGCGIPSDFIELTKSRGIIVDITTSQRSLLTLLFTKICNIDPDILVGHDVFEHIFKLLIHSIITQKVSNWSMLGRLKQNKLPKVSKIHDGIPIYCGRLVVELKSLADELVKFSSYDLSELCKQVLKLQRHSMEWSDINNYFTQSSSLLDLINHSTRDSFFCLKIMDELSIIPMFTQISTICGQPLGRTLVLGRAERIEYLLLHGFVDSKCICPDKWNRIDRSKKSLQVHAMDEGEYSKKRKSAYEGGLVLEPKSGFYPYCILVLDYMSLYPSLIQEFNICFTTTRFIQEEGNENKIAIPIETASAQQGILPREIRKLVECRMKVKSLLQSVNCTSSEYMRLEIRQKALKLIANSIYGCLGYTNSRFYAKPLAALVTRKGRELLNRTKEIVESMGFDVIYGDTDSIMVNTKSEDYWKSKEIGQRIISSINKNYHNLKIELEGVFNPMLLLKKKKYAAMSWIMESDGKLTQNKQMKGIDIVRHDWSVVAKEAGAQVLDLILNSVNHDLLAEKIKDFLMDLNDQINKGQIGLEKFIIKKNLTKRLEEYSDKKSQAHLLVAHRLLANGKKVTVGDTIEYIICMDGTSSSHVHRGYHISEVKDNSYPVDIKYYKESQIFPVIQRLCECIEELDPVLLSKCLGISSSKSLSYPTYNEKEPDDDIERLKIPCENCSNTWTLDVVLSLKETTKSLLTCQNCGSTIGTVRFLNAIDQMIYQHCQEYYKNVIICNDPTCEADIPAISLSSYLCTYKCICGHGNLKLKYPSSKLYKQLIYLYNLFDPNSQCKQGISQTATLRLKGLIEDLSSGKYSQSFNYILNKLNYIMDLNSYANVNLSEIF